MWRARKMSITNLDAAFDHRRRDSKPVAVKEKRPIGITDGSLTPTNQYRSSTLPHEIRSQHSFGGVSMTNQRHSHFQHRRVCGLEMEINPQPDTEHSHFQHTVLGTVGMEMGIRLARNL